MGSHSSQVVARRRRDKRLRLQLSTHRGAGHETLLQARRSVDVTMYKPTLLGKEAWKLAVLH